MPLYKYMDAPCVQAFVGMMSDVFLKGDHFKIVFTQGENVCLARNKMFEYIAGINGVDYVLALDSDHEYSAKALYDLIAKIERYDLPAISASYYVRGDRKFSMIRRGDDGVYRNVDVDSLGSGVQKCDVFGFGFVVFRHSTIKQMIAKHPHPFVMTGDKDTGEDFYFCKLMEDEGFNVFYDADTIVGHYTSFFNK